MSSDVLVVAEHANGKITDTTYELLGKAKELSSSLGGQAVVLLIGQPSLSAQLGAADLVISVDGAGLADYTAEGYERVAAEQVAQRQPRVVLISTTTQGLDLAGALSAMADAPLASYVVDVAVEDAAVVTTSQIYGGKIMAEVELGGPTAICAAIAGSFPADAGRGDGAPNVEFVAATDASDQRITFRALIEPDASDVDITAADVLVAIGRGIGSKDDIELVQELADALGAPLAASRPITDAGWLPKTRQVGKSGLTVKPRGYLMFGISGAPEHLEGMRDAELIIACNTDEAAPIFDVAHYGTTLDLFDLLPALTEQLGG